MIQIQRSPLSIHLKHPPAQAVARPDAPAMVGLRRQRPQPPAVAPLQAPQAARARSRHLGSAPHPIGVSVERAAARHGTAHLPGGAEVAPLSQADFSALMHEVIHDVREATGWRVSMPEHQVQCRAEVAAAMRKELLEGGVSPHIATKKGAQFADQTFAYYDPSARKVTLVAENARGMNYDALRSVLHHELVHTAQHQRYPQFLALADRWRELQASEDPRVRAVGRRVYFSILKLIEGHAHLMEMRACERYYPQAKLPRRQPSWVERFFHVSSDRAALQAFLHSPYAGALELEEAAQREPLHTVLKRLYGSLQATLETFRTPQERRLAAS